MARVVVAGYMLRHPYAGNVLAFFHYVLGLRLLGHDVVYLEESGWPYSSYNPVTSCLEDHPAAGLTFVRDLMAQHQLDVPVYFVNRDSRVVDGGTWADVERILRAADLLINVGGVCWLPEFSACRRRALIDMDPLFTQAGQFAAALLDRHDVHFSYGANIGRPGCSVPTAGVDWIATVPPVVTDIWGEAAPAADAPFTTVASWNAYGEVVLDGERYGQKDVEFLRLIDVPSRTSQRLEVALSSADDATRARLRAAGWAVRDAGSEVSFDVAAYQSYLRASRGEFSVAKHAYVKTRSGWFSDRSVCYLAAGLPVVLQDTGFSEWLPTGRGVLAFNTADEAVECLTAVNAGYTAHRAAARELAHGVFGHDVVLPRLMSIALS
jgi:hypothetical protein